MTLFLFFKQLVDMLYMYKTLDYLMVIWVLILLAYQVALVRPDIKKYVTWTDAFVIWLAAMVTSSFLRNMAGYDIFFKVLSAFLMFFVGRIYYDRIQECYGALVASAYIVVYINFFKRFLRFGLDFFHVTNAEGDLYYYDTDMAFAMILALIFIMMLGHNTLFKFFTVFLACPLMVFKSDAGIQMVLLLAIVCVFVIYVFEMFVENQMIANVLLSLFIIGLLAVVVIIYLPVTGLVEADTILTLFGSKFLDNDNMYGRYEVWQGIIKTYNQGNLLDRLVGANLHDMVGMGSLYMKTIYSIGLVGAIMAIVFILDMIKYVVKVKDRKTFYLTIMLAIMILGTGVTVNSMEFTQMSWFPMMFCGMVVSSVQVEKNH